MKIIISGPPGSGKSTIAKLLSKNYSLRYISAGEIFREIAKKNGLSLLELNKKAEKNFEIDKLVDKEIYKIITETKDIVVESHIAGWLFKGLADFSVYLNASIEIRAERISKRDNISYQEALRQIIEREESHRKRFLQYYGIDITDLSVFDLVINTNNLTPNTIVKIIENYIQSTLPLKFH